MTSEDRRAAEALRVPVAEWDQMMVAQAACGHMANLLFNLRLVALQHADEAIRDQANVLLCALGPHNPHIVALYEAAVRHAESAADEGKSAADEGKSAADEGEGTPDEGEGGEG